ncbi:DUF481 domain-containing protein [Alloacidobacterium dinghuense]|uniref:DUF481 domain-containing protein n=1 Tax=Alloacidobacterium dinghuense TaxID=2763107 RepID=A0A7G8BMG4_9BACT|nr:DUF481 domain-containing protein [Alloacidobacterium dinghuense]QNI33734.1 DUF481 domain-containing protein [Alloacidobacterium dinghuense]
MNPWMNVVSSALLFILTAPLFARDKTDVLVMKNGDRMTCEVKGLDAGVLYVSFDYIDGTTSVDWSKVARLESTQLFVVRTEAGDSYTGTLKTPESPADRPAKIEVVEIPAPETAVVDRAQVVQMVATSDRFWERFNGEVSFGVIYSKGNESTQFSLGSQVNYVRERWTIASNYSSNLSSSTGVTTSTRNSLNLYAGHLLPKENWFYAGIGDFLQSSEQQITLQSTVGGGIGRYVKNTNRSHIALLGGAAWQNTTYGQTISAGTKQSIATALIYADAKFFRFSKTSLDINGVLLPALSDPGRVRFNTNASYYVKILGNLTWNASFYGNWDNRPPAGLPGSDYGSSSGLSWTFGLK